MKKIILSLMLAILLSHPAQADDNLLTGDTRLACEAILCLSSGTRPGECGPALSRYFGISHKKWSDTVKARRNFLKLCPASSEGDMPTLVEALVNGAGQCTAELLNRLQRRSVVVKECIPDDVWNTMNRIEREDKEQCWEKTVYIIDDTLPGYCKAYADHAYTHQVGVRYVGDKLNGGHWVDE